jgi:putative membrane protein
MDAEAIGAVLAPVNAVLNASSATFLLAGLAFIKRREVRRHRFAMTGAVAASSLFLVFYVIRFSFTGVHEFAGEGVARVVYLSILFSHITLAVVVLPMVIRLLYLVRRRRFHAHSRLARWTAPLWIYVSITGLLVYALLYHVYGYR